MRPGSLLIAAVDEVDGQLKCVQIFEWDRTYTIPASNDPKFPAWMRKVGLRRRPDRLVDITARPDIQVGEPYPFAPKKEADA